jgi:hypothetical protein
MSARDRRALSLGALVIAATIAGARGVPALREWSATSVASAREVVGEAERARRGLLGADALADTMRARSERLVALAPALLDGKSAATAGATLASLVSGAAAASDAKLGSVQVRADTAVRDSSAAARRAFTRVAVRASLTADVRGLSRFLLALERGLTLLSIDELSVTQPEPGADGMRPEMLQVEIVVAGLALTTRRTTR